MTSSSLALENKPKPENEIKRLYTPEEVEEFLRKAGFSEERIPQIMEKVRKGFGSRKQPPKQPGD